MCGIAFGILIGQQIAAGELSGQRALIFAGNELEILAQVRQFLQNRRGNDR
jgi:NADPH-dependent ferric siderophore reductase